MSIMQGHDDDCALVAAGYNGDMYGHCSCVSGARETLHRAERAAASRLAAAEAAQKPVTDAYQRGLEQGRREMDARLRALEETVARLSKKTTDRGAGSS